MTPRTGPHYRRLAPAARPDRRGREEERGSARYGSASRPRRVVELRPIAPWFALQTPLDHAPSHRIPHAPPSGPGPPRRGSTSS